VRHWWRSEPKIEVASVEQLQQRVVELERLLGRRGGRTLSVLAEEYKPLKHLGVIRDAEDEIQGVFDPELGAFMLDPEVQAHGRSLMEKLGDRMPDSVKAAMEKAAQARWGDLPAMQNSSVGWRDVLTPRRVLAASGTQISNSTSETILCPDFTFAADYFEVGDAFKYSILFEQSSVITTPGTQTYRLRYGGVAGTAMATSGAFAPDPTAAATSISMMLEFWTVCRSVGSAGSFMTMGRYTPNDHDDASATTLKGNLDMQMIPTSAPAAVGSLDTTTAKAISPTYQSSVNTAGTNATSHIAILESLN
jgi:hypothetical protein